VAHTREASGHGQAWVRSQVKCDPWVQEPDERHIVGSWIGCEVGTSRDVDGRRARGCKAGEVERRGEGRAHGAEWQDCGAMPTRGWG
jgi:hypothetical protein